MACALCGCGGSGAGTRTASRTPAYVAAGDAICAQELSQLDTLKRPGTPEQALGYLPRVLAIMHSETARLAALRPPAPARQQLDAALDGTRQLDRTLAAFLRELRSGMLQLATFGTVQSRSVALSEQLDRHFRLAGLSRCAH
jgi:hypothetical protein